MSPSPLTVSLQPTHTHTPTFHKQTVPHAVPIHVTLYESCNLNKFTSFDSAEWKTFGTRRWSQTQSQHPMVMTDPP